jgi:phosphatidylglycerophosphate synthase
MNQRIRAQIPNTLTMTRLLLGLVFPLLPASWWIPALLWGTLSEFLDGFISRKLRIISAWGQLLDPIADKIFVTAAALTFLHAGLMTFPQLIWMASRDLLVALSSLMLIVQGKKTLFRDMTPLPSGKVTTTFQLMTLFALPSLGESSLILIYLTGSISLLSALDYTRRFLRSSARCSNRAKNGSISHF